MEKKHAIIVIKKDNKYLQYYDEIWSSYLFLNCKISNELDYEYIIKEIKEKYNIDIAELNLVMDKIHTKYSVKDKIEKEYHHYFYTVNTYNDNNSNSSIKYFSYDELLNDSRIQEVNSDIVSFIKEI